MATNQQKINDIKYLIMEHYSDKEPLNDNQKKSKQCFYRYCDQIKKDLERLEKQDKVIEIIKQVIKSVHDSKSQIVCKLPNGKVITTDLGYVEEFINKVCEEYDLLKEVFG